MGKHVLYEKCYRLEIHYELDCGTTHVIVLPIEKRKSVLSSSGNTTHGYFAVHDSYMMTFYVIHSGVFAKNIFYRTYQNLPMADNLLCRFGYKIILSNLK